MSDERERAGLVRAVELLEARKEALAEGATRSPITATQSLEATHCADIIRAALADLGEEPRATGPKHCPGCDGGCASCRALPAAPATGQQETLATWAICPRCRDRVTTKHVDGREVFVAHASKGDSPRMHCRESGQPPAALPVELGEAPKAVTCVACGGPTKRWDGPAGWHSSGSEAEKLDGCCEDPEAGWYCCVKRGELRVPDANSDMGRALASRRAPTAEPTKPKAP